MPVIAKSLKSTIIPAVLVLMSWVAGEVASAPGENPDTDTNTHSIIDVHVHFFSCQNGFPGSTPYQGSTNCLDKVDEWMKAKHVERCINLPLSQSRPRNEEQRKLMLENYAKYKGRIDRFCVIYPDEVTSVEEAVKLLIREKQDGAIGFGEHYGVGLKFDDPRNLRLYEACDKVGLPVLFHIDRNKNMDEKGLPGLEHVLKTFPNLTLIAHSFWWKHLSDGTCDSLLKTYPNLYADISATVRMSRIGTDKLVRGHVHELHLPGLRDRTGQSLLHDVAYYTINEIPNP